MTLQYRAVGWNRNKRRYDLALAVGLLGYLLLFGIVGTLRHPFAPLETHFIRATGSAAFILLHVVLLIGPLCRLDRRWLPLLYNRRHLGVCMFLVALLHGGFTLLYFHGAGDTNPFVSLFTANSRWDSLAHFPFEPLGALALLVLFFMAATSHDFWLANLTAPVWKALHMLVYAAYALVVLHVLLGALQSETHPWLAAVTALGAAAVLVAHGAAAAREAPRDAPTGAGAAAPPAADAGVGAGSRATAPARWVDVGAADDIPDGRALTAMVAGERVAVFRYGDRLSAVSSVCQHQNGPLGEGRVIDGCITCPWHGYQYLPDCGRSPEPFTERIPTFALRVVDGRVQVDGRPLPAGTRVEPVHLAERPGARPAPAVAAHAVAAHAAAAHAAAAPAAAAPADEPFFVGYLPPSPGSLARVRRATFGLIALGWLLGVSFVFAQRPFARARFEYLEPRQFSGRVALTPQPTLVLDAPVDQGGAPTPAASASRALLVSEFKWGAGPALAGYDGAHVTLSGTLAWRDEQLLIELVPGSVRRLDAAPAPAGADGGGGSVTDRPAGSPLGPGQGAVADLGVHTLTGEIVDSKCFLGVMNPGHLKVHRSCAVRCISGGIPPVLVVRDRHGVASQLVLVDAAGRMLNDRILGMIAEPLEITGRVERHDDLLYLFADPETFRRLP